MVEQRCVDNSQTQMSSEQSTVHRTSDNSQSGTNISQSGTNNAQSGTNNSQSGTDNSQSNNRVSQNDHRDNKTISRLPNPLRDEESVARLKEQSVLSGQPMGTRRLEDIPLTAENKVDLFKAIFLSSDEEEDEDEKKEEDKDKDKKTEDRTGGVELETPGEPDKTNEKVDSNNEKVVVTKEKTNEKTGKVNTKDKNTEEVKDNPMKTMEMTSKENEGRENEKTGEINNVEDLYGPKLPGQLSKQVEDNVGSVGEVVNINNAQTNTTNSGLGLLGALEDDRMSVSKKRNTEVVGVRFEKPNKIGKDKNHTSRTSILQESKQELETEGSEMEDKVESGGDIVGSQEVGGEPSDVVVIVKEEEEDDDVPQTPRFGTLGSDIPIFIRSFFIIILINNSRYIPMLFYYNCSILKLVLVPM
uniref:Uncharacterized protein n=1 Tax=Cacopsylla melanoneura TaxID=428564 RepID=A0A8D8ZTA8_9HEMI